MNGAPSRYHGKSGDRKENVDESNTNGHAPGSGPGPVPQRGASRYNRSYTNSPANAPRGAVHDQLDADVGDMAQYALSEDFQSLTTRKTLPNRRRRRKGKPDKDTVADAPNAVTMNGSGSQKSTPKKPAQNAAKKRNDRPAPSSKKGANAVPLAVPKARPAPTNWAANLKPKPLSKTTTAAPTGTQRVGAVPSSSVNGTA